MGILINGKKDSTLLNLRDRTNDTSSIKQSVQTISYSLGELMCWFTHRRYLVGGLDTDFLLKS